MAQRGWENNILLKNGLDKTGSLEEIAITPFSEVKKITVGTDIYYLKKTPAPLFLEADILGFLNRIDPGFAIPQLVDADKDNLCFLTRACGQQTLRTLFGGQLRADLLVKSVQEYQRIQKACVPHIPELLAMGVPDWGLSRLPDLYNRFVSDVAALARWSIEPVTCEKLQDFKPFFADICQSIEAYKIPDTLNHSDFQENNMVINTATGHISIIDWGEVMIGHALWPVVGFLKKICWRYKVRQDSAEFYSLLDHFLHGWGIRQSEAGNVFKKVSIIEGFYYALSLAELEKNTGQTSPVWSARIKMALDSLSEMPSAP